MEHWMKNEYYPDAEAYLFAIAEAMAEEYKAIVDAGFILQIDDPDLADAWQMHPEMSLSEYRNYQTVRIAALNHALAGLPQDRIRFHMCCGQSSRSAQIRHSTRGHRRPHLVSSRRSLFH